MRTVSLDTSFFDNHKIKALAETENGVLKIITWLKLLCFAGQTNDGGRIYRVKGEVLTRPYLASVLGITESQVGEYLVTFKKLRMIYFDQDKCMRLTNWSKWQTNFLEKDQENRREREKESVPPTPPYKEKVQEKTRETEKDACSPSKDNLLVKQIIDHLNLILGSKYRYCTVSTVRHITARIRDGYRLEDFKKVIEYKYEEWNGTEMEKFLRPETLFGTKFESYLQNAQKETKNSSFDEKDFIRNAIERSLT